MIGPETSPTYNTSSHEWGVFKKVGLNTTWLTAARLGSQLFLLIFSMVVARRMGDSGLGAYAYLTAFIFIGNVLTTFGTDMLVVREVAAHRDFSWLAPAMILQLILSSLFVLTVFLIPTRIASQEVQLAVAMRLYSLALFPLAIYTVCSAVLRGLERMAPLMWISLLLAGSQAVLAAWIVHTGSSIITLSWILLVVQVIAASAAFSYCQFRIPGFTLVTRTNWRLLSKLIAASFPLASVAVIKILYQKITVLMLNHFQGLDVTGWFSASLRMVEASQFIHIAVLGSVFPIMAFKSMRQKDVSSEQERVLAISWKLLLTLGVTLAGALYLFSKPIIILVYGSEFAPSILALQILAWLMIPYSANLYLSSWLISAKQEKRLLLILVSSLVLLLIWDSLLIPAYGLAGASVATLLAEALQAVLFIAARYFAKLASQSP